MTCDLHTHRPAPYPEGIVSCGPEEFSPVAGQLYSAGLHPWRLDAASLDSRLRLLEEVAARPEVVAVGECGLDAMRGAPMWVQVNAFKAQALLAERLRKPLIVHDVKCHEGILGVHRDVSPTVPWVIHGFRGKPSVAEMFLRRGIALSFGERFNAETLRMVPAHMIFAETDESRLPIGEIIASLSAARGEDMLPVVTANIEKLRGCGRTPEFGENVGMLPGTSVDSQQIRADAPGCIPTSRTVLQHPDIHLI